MENDSMENEEKKTRQTYLCNSFVSHLPLFQPVIPTNTKKPNKFITG